MNRCLATLLLATLPLIATVPTAAATPYNVCAPANAVCVVQADSPYAGPACDNYPWRYAVNSDVNAIYVNAAGVTASAGAQNMCTNWFYNDGDYQGFFATGAAPGASANVGWYRYDVDYHWAGAPRDVHGEYVTATANVGSGNTGVMWIHRVTPSAGTDTCDTLVYVNGAPTSVGCPAGLPPAPPAAAWGSILP